MTVPDTGILRDLVFGLGRSALEAMACRRVVVVFDYNGGDGLVTPERFELLRQRNFSGRTHARRFSDAELAAEIAGDPLVGQWLTDVLAAEGHQVETVDSGRAGLERLRAATFALVLTDLRMPDVDGIGVYQELERTQPRMAQRVIFVSGNTREPRYQRFLSGLEDRNLSKPFDINQLTRLVRRKLGTATE